MSYVKPDQLIDSIVQAGVDKANLSVGQMLARGTLSGAILVCATTVAFPQPSRQGLPSSEPSFSRSASSSSFCSGSNW